MEKLIYDLPQNQGAANALKRAESHVAIRWVPVTKLPRTARVDKTSEPPVSFFAEKRPQHGLPYSSAKDEEKFLCYNVSLDTWFSALKNPKSVLYTRSLLKRGRRMNTWYGEVCSTYVSYCMDLPLRRVAKQFLSSEDFIPTNAATAQELQLCDILANKKHVAMVTAIGRNAAGQVKEIQVSEARPPQTIVMDYTVEEFEDYWFPKYGVYRYTGLEQVSYEPCPYVHLEGDPDLPYPAINTTLLPDYGDKANYDLGQPVELNIMEDGWSELVVEKENGETVYTEKIAAPGIMAYMPVQAGFYRAYCRRGEEKSPAAEFSVVEFTLEQKGEKLYCRLPESADVIGYVAVNQGTKTTMGTCLLTEKEREDRYIDLAGYAPAQYLIKAIAQNKFGQYRSTPCIAEIG